MYTSDERALGHLKPVRTLNLATEQYDRFSNTLFVPMKTFESPRNSQETFAVLENTTKLRSTFSFSDTFFAILAFLSINR